MVIFLLFLNSQSSLQVFIKKKAMEEDLTKMFKIQEGAFLKNSESESPTFLLDNCYDHKILQKVGKVMPSTFQVKSYMISTTTF